MLIWLFLALGVSALDFVKYQWSLLNYTFDSTQDCEAYFNNKVYTKAIPHSIAANSVGDVFISIPRSYADVPASLGVIKDTELASPLIQPFPSWEVNQANDPSHLHSVSAIFVDDSDHLWALDQGISNNSFDKDAVKLVQFIGEVMQIYPLAGVVTQDSNLSDLALDLKDKKAYISDSSKLTPGIIQIDLVNKQSQRVVTTGPSVEPDKALWITLNNNQRVSSKSPLEGGVSGLALSCDRTTLYYSPLTSRYLYAVEIGKWQPKNLGYRWSAGSAILSSKKGKLYLAGVENNAIREVNSIKFSVQNLQFNEHSVVFGTDRLGWPNAMCFTYHDTLLVLSNNFDQFLNGTMQFTESNFLVWSIHKDDASYIEGCDYSQENNDDAGFPLWAISVIVFMSVLFVISLFCFFKYFSAYRKKQKRRREAANALLN